MYLSHFFFIKSCLKFDYFSFYICIAHLCKIGPGRMRPHRSLQHCLKRCLTRVGAEVDMERAVPTLYRWKDVDVKRDTGDEAKVQEPAPVAGRRQQPDSLGRLVLRLGTTTCVPSGVDCVVNN